MDCWLTLIEVIARSAARLKPNAGIGFRKEPKHSFIKKAPVKTDALLYG